MEFEAEAKRKHFITKQDVANVRVKIKDLTVIRNQEDATSVDLFVRELQQEPYDPILLYKRQQEIDPEYPTLPRESFLLELQTEFQKHLYQEHASNVLCFDYTHDTNAYKFKLITVMIADEYGQGLYMFSVQIQCIPKLHTFNVQYRTSCGMVH